MTFVIVIFAIGNILTLSVALLVASAAAIHVLTALTLLGLAGLALLAVSELRALGAFCRVSCRECDDSLLDLCRAGAA